MKYTLRYATKQQWTQTVLDNFDQFLQDHATCEKKASGMAMSMASHYPDRTHLVKSMIDLAIEELTHFREVVKLLHERGLILAADVKDPYINQIQKLIRRGSDHYFIDRLLTCSIIESRGHERFGLIAAALPAGKLKNFYQGITQSEARHTDLFIDLAERYFSPTEIHPRIDELLDEEARIVENLPFTPSLH